MFPCHQPKPRTTRLVRVMLTWQAPSTTYRCKTNMSGNTEAGVDPTSPSLLSFTTELIHKTAPIWWFYPVLLLERRLTLSTVAQMKGPPMKTEQSGQKVGRTEPLRTFPLPSYCPKKHHLYTVEMLILATEWVTSGFLHCRIFHHSDQTAPVFLSETQGQRQRE